MGMGCQLPTPPPSLSSSNKQPRKSPGGKGGMTLGQSIPSFMWMGHSYRERGPATPLRPTQQTSLLDTS